MAYKTSSPKTNNSVLQPKSRYVQGGLTTRYQNRLGWWERQELEVREDDISITIESDEAQRPDKIAANVYDDDSLTWLVMQYNGIVDPITELSAGETLRLPSPRRVMLSIMRQSPGGRRPEES